jgi:hypothetical protein
MDSPVTKQTDFMVHQFRSRPLKEIYLILELIITLFLRLPSWILGNVPKELRPQPSWSLKKSVLIKALRHSTWKVG